MCRILAQLSIKPQTAEPYLTQAPWSLLAQSSAKPNELQEDGWGIAWYNKNSKPKLVRSTLPIFREAKRFSELTRKSSSSCLVAHVRAASNPLRLPKDRLLRLENTQPFVRGNWIFAHNGTLHMVQEVKARLGGETLPLEGDNDSELLFELFLDSMERSFGGFPYAVHLMMERLDQIWRSRASRYPRLRWIASGLNFVATNGSSLITFCHWVLRPRQSHSLGLGIQPFYQMSYSPHKDRLVIASEPTDKVHPWYPIPHGHLLTVAVQKGLLQYGMDRIPN